MKKILLTILICFTCFSVNAQIDEPKNNLGKSLYQMKQDFPDLRYIGTDSNGAKYSDGYPQDGIGFYFYLKNDIVVEEFMLVQSEDGFAHILYEETAKSFQKTSYKYAINETHSKHWLYSNFTLHLIFIIEDGINTTLLIYKNGGYNTGVARDDFFNMYE